MKKNSLGKMILDAITGIFSPVINVITAVSILKGLLMLATMTGVMTADQGIYQVLYACADGFFYFLPFFLAYTASVQWHTDPFIAMLIPVTMLYPDLVRIVENGEGAISLLGITVPNTVYHSSVLPVIFAVALLAILEKICDRCIPESIRGFSKPLICCVIVLPVVFLIFGPAGKIIGDAIAAIFTKIYEANPILAGAFMGFVIQPMVCVGAHWSIVPVSINNIATQGYDLIMPLVGAAVYGQAAAALCVGLMYPKTKEYKEKRRIAFQASLAAALGVTEPALFGVNMGMVWPLFTGCIAGAVGGAMVGAAGAHCNSFAFPSILTSVVYLGPGFGIFMLSMPIGFIVSMLLMYLQRNKMKSLSE